MTTKRTRKTDSGWVPNAALDLSGDVAREHDSPAGSVEACEIQIPETGHYEQTDVMEEAIKPMNNEQREAYLMAEQREKVETERVPLWKLP